MAFDPTFRTSQEYLNIKAGFTGPLRTKQECLNSLAGVVNPVNQVMSKGNSTNLYAGTTGKAQQIALNIKVGSIDNTLTKQEAIRRL